MALRVLVVDDATFVRDLVKRTMRSHFPQITLDEAINGRKAQVLMSKQVYDLILCDWEMPEMSGLELLRWARAHDHYKKIPFVMVTSRGDRGHVVEAVQEGVSDYLGKPFSAEMLTQKVSKALGNRLRQAGAAGSSGPKVGGDSASVLTGASAQAKGVGASPRAEPSPASASAALLTGQSVDSGSREKKSEPTATSANPKGMAKIRFAEFSLPCIIKAISLTEVMVVARSGQRFPMILEPAVVDIEADEAQVLERINGYVHSLKAVDKRMDTDFVQLIVRFVDEDPDKMASLSRFIEKFN